jgi:hypothetical protein
VPTSSRTRSRSAPNSNEPTADSDPPGSSPTPVSPRECLQMLATHVHAAEVAHTNLLDYLLPPRAVPHEVRAPLQRLRAPYFSNAQAALSAIHADDAHAVLFAYLCIEMLDANTRFYAEEGLSPEVVNTPADIAVATACYQQLGRACTELRADRALMLSILQQPDQPPEQPRPEQPAEVQLPTWEDGPFCVAYFLGLLPRAFRPLTSELLAANVRQPQLVLPRGMAEAWSQALTTLQRRAASSYENVNAVRDLEFDLQRLAPRWKSSRRSTS